MVSILLALFHESFIELSVNLPKWYLRTQSFIILKKDSYQNLIIISYYGRKCVVTRLVFQYNSCTEYVFYIIHTVPASPLCCYNYVITSKKTKYFLFRLRVFLSSLKCTFISLVLTSLLDVSVHIVPSEPIVAIVQYFLSAFFLNSFLS